MTQPIGIFGGTFDPVHYGHLRTALELQEALDLAQVRFMPCGTPPHREPPLASAQQRLAMLVLAVEEQPALMVDERELQRPGPSYMVDTLTSLREELGETPLCLLLGGDAFNGLTTWHRWQDLINLAHLVVMHRPGWTVAPAQEGELGALLAGRLVTDKAPLHEQPAGCVLLQEVTQLDIAATTIRERVAAGRSPRYLLPEPVWDYIQREGLYRASDGPN